MIKRVSLPEELSRRLQQQISLGNIRAGEKLPTEPELMQQFGVSRSTVREAVRILSNAGWIQVRQGLGTFVSPKMPDSEPLTQRLRRG
ncbi:MAG: FadR family transcriptional regulator, partial [Siphonobacter aquaeclarae]|nr:FadR family transcriptional regulator [Siphonobacter aquaeclarae]